MVFLLLALLLIQLAAELQPASLMGSHFMSMFLGIIFYLTTLGAIALQNILLPRNLKTHAQKVFFLANTELLVFLFFFHFVFGGYSFWFQTTSHTIPVFLSFGLYALGIAVFQATTKSPNSWNKLRVLLPFAIPILFFNLILDAGNFLLPHSFMDAFLSEKRGFSFLVFLVVILFFLGNVLVFLPYFLQKFWSCKPLENVPLKKMLEETCDKTNFRHGGILVWTAMNRSLTAAIIGIVPRFRYVLFTRKILREFTPEELQAILVHEIGHSYRRHLLWFPFIFLGMIIGLWGLSLLTEPTAEFFMSLSSKKYRTVVYSLTILIPTAGFIWFYVRVIFGYFSRLFERQADLHLYKAQIEPQNMIQALDHLGKATGNSHLIPNWHHHSIQERIDFLQYSMQDPSQVEKHHTKVRWALAVYTIAVFCVGLAFLAAM